jgi:hypothetical protein
MKRKTIDYLITLLGLTLLAAGLYLVKSAADPQGFLKTLPYLCIGLGCGAFGHGMGNIISRKAYQSNPQLQKKIEIEQKDERNIAVANHAKAKAYDLMLYVFGALTLSFALLEINMTVILLLVFSYLLVIIYFIYHLMKYDREM